MNNDDVFKKHMQGVKPLSKKPSLVFKKTTSHINTQTARQNAIKHPSADEPRFSETVKSIEPNEIIGFQRPGIQHRVFQQLKSGKCLLDAHLDLHQQTIQQAYISVDHFIHHCTHQQYQTILIITGKGERAKKAILKSHLAHWLPSITTVQAFHTAQPKHGGSGAFYVRLKRL